MFMATTTIIIFLC